jgi:hypothetical protein
VFEKGLSRGKFPSSFAELTPEAMFKAGTLDAGCLSRGPVVRAYPQLGSVTEPATVRLARRLADEAVLRLASRFVNDVERIEQQDEGASAAREIEARRRDCRARAAQLGNRFLLLADAYHAGNLAARRPLEETGEPEWREALEPLQIPIALEETAFEPWVRDPGVAAAHGATVQTTQGAEPHALLGTAT